MTGLSGTVQMCYLGEWEIKGQWAHTGKSLGWQQDSSRATGSPQKLRSQEINAARNVVLLVPQLLTFFLFNPAEDICVVSSHKITVTRNRNNDTTKRTGRVDIQHFDRIKLCLGKLLLAMIPKGIVPVSSFRNSHSYLHASYLSRSPEVTG